jgi:hypothetical protein
LILRSRTGTPVAVFAECGLLAEQHGTSVSC